MRLRAEFLSVRIVLVSLLLLVLLPTLGAVGLVLNSNAHLQQRAIERNLQVRARSLAAEVDARLEELAAELEAVAPEFSASREPTARARATAERRLTEDADWHAIALLDSNHRQIMLAGPPSSAGDVERLAQRLRGAAAQYFEVVADTAPGARAIVGIAVPLRLDSVVTAIVLGIPRHAGLLPQLNRFDRSEGALTGVVTADGELIATSHPESIEQSWPETPIRGAAEPASAKVVKVSLQGRPSYVAGSRLHVAPWFVAYAEPSQLVEAPLRLSNRLIGGLALLLTLPLTLVLLLGRFLAEQIRNLTLAAGAVAAEQQPPAIRPSPLREVAAVQHALQHAAEMIQERAQARERLRVAGLNLARLQRLDTVGQLAAGIAHDFGNYLFTIRGNLELIRSATAENPLVQQRVIPALVLAQKALELVQQLSTLARRRPTEAGQINVAEVLQEIAELLRHVAGPTIRLEFSLARRLWDCWFDRLRLQSALVNLVTNARNAMPGGGTIRIGARNRMLDPEHAGRLRLPTGRYVEVSVSDNGRGMSPEIMAHVFEPFFTTRTAEQGNGIGLSLLHGWVIAAGGHVSVESTPDVGTNFILLLPEHRPPAPNPA